MKTLSSESIRQAAANFQLPRYHEIPNVGLYLEQVTKYISEYLSPLQEGCITGSMISNYVKKGLVANPIKKQYSREQIAYLIFIALAKNILSLDNLAQFIQLQKQTYPSEQAYNYFCNELENMLQVVFGLKATPDDVGTDSTDAKVMLRNTIIAVTHKIFLEKCFKLMAAESAEQN